MVIISMLWLRRNYMTIFAIIIFFILVILFIPLKVRITLSFDKCSGLQIFIYNYNIKTSKIYKKLTSKEKKAKKAKEPKKNININTLWLLLKKLDNNSYKPKLYLNSNIDFQVEDAAYTAMIYGISNALIPFIERFINVFFSISSFKIHINPLFNNENSVSFNIKSIIKVNLAKLIYMAIIIYKYGGEALKRA